MIHGKQIRDASVNIIKLLLDNDLPMSGHKITGLGAPINNNDATTKLYVDSIAQSLSIKDAVKVATTSVSELENTSGAAYKWNANLGGGEGNDYWSNVITPKSIDGIAINDGDRILIKDGGDAKGNGIWVYSDSTNRFNRAPDANNQGGSPSNDEVKIGMFCFVQEGAINSNAGFVLTASGGSPSTPPIYDLGIDTLTFTQFTGAGQIIAGDALTKTGNQLDVLYDNSTIGITGNYLYIKDGGVDTNQLASGAVTEIKIETGAVTNTKIVNNAVTYDKLNSNVVYSAGAIELLTGTPDTGLAVVVDNVTIEIVANTNSVKEGPSVTVSALSVKDGGIDTDHLASGAVTTDKINPDDGTPGQLLSIAAGSPNITAWTDIDQIPGIRSYRSGNIQTTDATETLLDTIDNIPDNATTAIEVLIKAFQTSATNYGVWKRTLVVTKVSGTPTIQFESDGITQTSIGLDAESIDFVISDGNILINVTGIVATTIDWASDYEIN